MGPVDYLAIATIVLAVGGAVLYILLAKKRGEKCIGCPYAKQCAEKRQGYPCHALVEEDEKKK